MGWRSGFSEKTVRKFAELRIYYYTVSGKKRSPPRDCTGDIRVIELFTEITEQEASNSELYLQFLPAR